MKKPTFSFHARPVIGAALLFGFLIAGCKKPDENLGLNVLDPAATLGTQVTDTTTIITWVKEQLPTRTSGLSRCLLGTYLDPDFGVVSAGIVAQVRLSANDVGTGVDPDSLTCDSLVLSLAFDAAGAAYGNLDPQVFKVFRLAEDLSVDSIYKSDRVPRVDLEELTEGTRDEYRPDPYHKPVIDGDSLSPQLRIRLKKSLGEELLAQWGGSPLVNNDVFLKYFKGLFILPDDENLSAYQRGVLTFNMLNGDTRLVLYYHSPTDTTHYDFLINSNSVRYTVARFDHYRATEPSLPSTLTDTTLGQQHVYVQPLGGLRAEVRFPYLDKLAQTPYKAIAKAELVVPILGEYFPLYPPPAQIFMFRKAVADGSDLVLPDQIPAEGTIGGEYNALTHEYRFNITRWVQGVITGKYPNTGVSLVPGSNGVSVNRAILGGPENPIAPMKLRLTFTTY